MRLAASVAAGDRTSLADRARSAEPATHGGRAARRRGAL